MSSDRRTGGDRRIDAGLVGSGLERLSRFEADGFRPVRPGELDAPFVHVFAHGWQPGYRIRERLFATTDRVAALPAWDPRLVDATGRPLISDYLPLLQALAALGPDHAVLWYSWLDESATDADVFQAHRSRQATQVNGRRLAAALQLALPGNDQSGTNLSGANLSGNNLSRNGLSDKESRTRIQLIGHSHGSAVVAHAAVSMVRAPDHVTLLDAPEDPFSRLGGASDLIGVVLPRLRPVRHEGGTFVDSYASAFGRPYHHRPGLEHVVDVQLGVPLSVSRDAFRTINAAHLYPVDWYARSVRASLDPAGPGVGYGWSPLAGGRTTELRPWYHAPWPARPLVLNRNLREVLTENGSRLVGRFAGPPRTRRRHLPELRLELLGTAPSAAGLVVAAAGEHLLEFDLQVRGCSGSERVEIDLDGLPAFLMTTAFPVPSSGRYLMLTDGPTGEHLVIARLVGASPGARVAILNARLVTGPRPVRSFTMSRSAATIFGAGVVSGSAATAILTAAGGLTARAVWTMVRGREARRR